MSTTVSKLLRSLRRRLWLERIGGSIRRGLWLVGPAAILIGAVHRWLAAVPLLAGIGIGLAPGLVWVGWHIARGRPSLATCARRADQLLGSRELMTSAFEIEQQGAEANRAKLLVTTAATRLAAAGVPRIPIFGATGATTAAPLALAAIGLFLLLNPGAQPVAARDLRVTPPVGDHALEPNGAPIDARDDSLATPEQRKRSTVASQGVVLPDPLEDEGPKPLLLPDTSGAGTDARAGELGKLAADGRPAPRLAEDVSLPDLEVHLVEVGAVDAVPDASTGAEGVELDAAADESSAAAEGTVAVKRRSTLNQWNRLSAEERRLADRYFERSPQE